jgi:hypothetical protein
MAELNKYNVVERGEVAIPTKAMLKPTVEKTEVWGTFSWFHSKASVSPLYWYACIVVGLVLATVPLILNVEESEEDFPQLYSEPYKLALTINVVLGAPMLIDTVLDFFTAVNPAAERVRVLLAITVTIPAVLSISLCFDDDESAPNFLLYITLVMYHQIAQYCLIYQILNIHDKEIWTDVRISVFHVLHVLGWSCFSWVRWLRMPGLIYLGVMAFSANISIVMYVFLALWIPKYWNILRVAISRHMSSSGSWFTKYIFGLESSIYGYMTPDEAVSIFYIAVTFSMVVITMIYFGELKGYLYGAYSQAAFILLLTVYPGRVARQNALKSDVSRPVSL